MIVTMCWQLSMKIVILEMKLMVKCVKLPWIPDIGPKIRKELKKTGCKVIFVFIANLKSILCRTCLNFYQTASLAYIS